MADKIWKKLLAEMWPLGLRDLHHGSINYEGEPFLLHVSRHSLKEYTSLFPPEVLCFRQGKTEQELCKHTSKHPDRGKPAWHLLAQSTEYDIHLRLRNLLVITTSVNKSELHIMSVFVRLAAFFFLQNEQNNINNNNSPEKPSSNATSVLYSTLL